MEEREVRALATARTEKDYASAEMAARGRLTDREADAKERYVSLWTSLVLQAQVGEREKAFASLSLASQSDPRASCSSRVDRAWDLIRDDPRFAAAVMACRHSLEGEADDVCSSQRTWRSIAGATRRVS